MSKLIKFTLVAFLLLLAQFNNNLEAQEPDSSMLEISILTCDYGHDFATAFGHVAIRVKDSKFHRDLVFDFGTFTFNEPFFVLKFMRGDLLYYLSIREFDRFYNDYTYENRTVTEQKLNLTSEQKIRIFRGLLKNYRPENRYYKYDFITDNCATRIRDIFTHSDFTHPQHTTDNSYREYLNYYLDSKEWLQFGIDILLGQAVDKKANITEAMFLPNTISNNIKLYTNTINQKQLADEPEILIRGEKHENRTNFYSPIIVFSIMLLLFVLLYRTKRNLLHRIAPYVYTLICAIGMIMIFMWFCSRYPCTKMNFNIMWALPLYILLPFPLGKKCKATILKVQTILLGCIILLGWWAFPQFINPAVYPLVAIIATINLNEIKLLTARK